MIYLVAVLVATASAQELPPVDPGSFSYAEPAPPLVVYLQLPDPFAYDYGQPLQYAQRYNAYCKYGYDQYGNCRPHEPVKLCTYGLDRFGNCRTMDPFCAFGQDIYGNCRMRDKTQCAYGINRRGLCRQEAPRFCAYGEDQHGKCHPQAQHCHFGHDQYGDCIKVSPKEISTM